MKERAGDLELINPCGRIPLIFQCTLGSEELPNWGLKIPCAIGRFKFHTCLKPTLPQELRQLCYSELKIPESSFFFFCHWEWGKKKSKNRLFQFGIGFVWGTERSQSLSAVFQRQQQWGDIWRLHPLPSTSWMFILCSHLDLLLCGISSHFRGSLKAIPRADQGMLVGSRWSIHTPMWFIASAHTQEENTRNQELMFWIPQAHSFVSMIRKSLTPPSQNKFTGIKGIIYCKWTRTPLICRMCPLLAKERLMKNQHIKDFKDN